MGERDNVPILAQYDFRTKQNYIFRTNKMREIVGASALITCIYDLFIRTLATKHGLKIEKNYTFPERSDGPEGWRYSVNRFIDLKYANCADVVFDPSFEGSNVSGKVLYVGGGNLYMLWRDMETAKHANGVLSELLRNEAYSLFPACGMTEYTGNYTEDFHALAVAFQRSKTELPPFAPMAVLPFTRVDRKTSFPVALHVTEYGQEEFLPIECGLKRAVCDKRIVVMDEDPLGVKELDDMTIKGTDSLLAVIHIDGNSMGERVSRTMNASGGILSYPEAIHRIREFSNGIQEDFVTKPLEDVSEWLRDHAKKARIIVAGGDDVTLICAARDARNILEVYFEALNAGNADRKSGDINTACAGVCIFHSHSPFATAYDIAEACCGKAKKQNRKNGGQNMLMDFQFCFSGITGDLDTIRETDAHLMGRPYSFNAENEQSILPFETLAKMANALKPVGREDSNSRRSVIKQLSALLLMRKDVAFDLEIRRLEAASGGAFKADLPMLKRVIFDLAQVYDIWFTEEGKPNEPHTA